MGLQDIEVRKQLEAIHVVPEANPPPIIRRDMFPNHPSGGRVGAWDCKGRKEGQGGIGVLRPDMGKGVNEVGKAARHQRRRMLPWLEGV